MILRIFCLVIMIVIIIFPPAMARQEYRDIKTRASFNEAEILLKRVAVHNVGLIAMTVSNFGQFGLGTSQPVHDPATGLQAPALSYPQGLNVNYLNEMQLWVGAIVGRDTLVSTAGWQDWYIQSEFWPDTIPVNEIKRRSILEPQQIDFDSAVSHQDFISYYCDTLWDYRWTGYDIFSRRIHIPIGVRVTQKSYAWGYNYAEDFILFDLEVSNITLRDINGVYIGLFVDNSVHRVGGPFGGSDDIVGFLKDFPSPYLSGLRDTFNIAWAADNNGDPDPVSGQFQGLFGATSAAGVMLLRPVPQEHNFSFNWWAVDYTTDYWSWGPRKKPMPGQTLRQFRGYYGDPASDADKYYIMSNHEVDYDLIDSWRDFTADGWMPPPTEPVWEGSNIMYVLATGPHKLYPGGTVNFTFAVVMGQNYWQGSWAAEFGGATRHLDDLALNALWASWVYDNPGVDTDGDGFKGKYHIRQAGYVLDYIDTIYLASDTIYDSVYKYIRNDTLFYSGDGIPDFVGAAPPTAPEFSPLPGVDEFNTGFIEVRWNGLASETNPDPFLNRNDFEGYRVYFSETGRPGDFTVLSSYDHLNYDRWEFDSTYNRWQVVDPPYTLSHLRNLYGENFDPELYPAEYKLFSHYNYQTQAYDQYYFTPHDWNQSNLFDTLAIHKRYPNEPYPPTLSVDSARIYWPDVLTESGRFKYFEYCYKIRNLLPSKEYFVSVTAFDQGNPARNLGSHETNPYDNAVRQFALPSSEYAMEKGLDVIVYPNPYYINGNYREHYEGWQYGQQNMPAEFTRTLNFANLPHKCVIRIFTIDGDLIRQIDHDYPPGAPGSMHESWDLITRNTMAIVSGIYYYSVESEFGNFIGKFVIIK